ncbi:hypothetical protein [Streptomyces sp. NBC_00286]|uniref:hypothetical protein n=1 Tax=Streptomyces sp. NBC_00286 TaxID=2975701 RepID=UPI002E297A41|nr:hypothetical protein [Streptomyces sp. NBC_00286]
MTAFSDTLAPTEDVWPGYAPICDPVRDPIGTSDHLLPPPDPAQRLDFTVLSAADQRRLDLYAALTVRGIAPRPGDRYAVDAISSLGDAVTDSVLRWITHRS